MRMLKAAVIAGLTLVSGGAMAQSFAPPPPPPEAGPPPPIPGPPGGFVLVPGHWRWNGVQYVWAPRHWVARRAGYAHWVPGHWNVGPAGGWHWIEGHWAP